MNRIEINDMLRDLDINTPADSTTLQEVIYKLWLKTKKLEEQIIGG